MIYVQLKTLNTIINSSKFEISESSAYEICVNKAHIREYSKRLADKTLKSITRIRLGDLH